MSNCARRGFGVARRLAPDDALQLLDLPALDVAEGELDALGRVVPLAVDELLQIALSLAQPLGDLVERVAPLGSVLLELRVRLLHHLLPLACEVGTEPRHELPLLLDGSLQPVGVLADLCVRLGHQRLLARLDALHVVREALLQLPDVARPVGEPLLDRGLGRDELLAEPLGGVALALGDVAAPFLCDPPLLLRELRQGVGAEPGERVLELLRPLRELLRDDLVEGALAALDLAFEQRAGARESSAGRACRRPARARRRSPRRRR